MAPAVGAHDPTSSDDDSSTSSRHLRSKQISPSHHDARPGPVPAPAPAPAPAPHHSRQADIARLSKLSHPAVPPAPSDHHHHVPKFPTRSRTFTRDVGLPTAVADNTASLLRDRPDPPRAPPAAPSIQDAVRPVLSERDSIFAEHYLPSDSALTIRAEGKHVAGARGSSGAAADPRRNEQEHPAGMAASPLRSMTSQFDFAPGLHHKHLPPSALSLLRQPHPQQPATRPHRPSRTSLPFSQHRHSLYDIHDLTSPPNEDILQTITPDGIAPFPSPSRSGELPSTPSSTSDGTGDAGDLDQSAERQRYRSWRKGQAKVNGMTIKESQRASGKTETGVDKVIDAQLPQPDLPMANARSRKASHYLGLFRENEAEERREHEKKKGGKSRDPRPEPQPFLSRDSDPKSDVRAPTIIEDIEAVEDGNDVTISKEHMVKKLPLGLLEEIRNHEQLAPRPVRRDTYSKQLPSRDVVQNVIELDAGKDSKSEDEESDREHISSATYFPHQHTLADSPTDDQLAERKSQHQTGAVPVPADGTSNDVKLSLQYEDSRDFLQGASEFQLPEPALPELELPPTPSDSDYETDYTLDSALSGTDVDEADTTPTATPNLRGSHQHRSPQRRRSHQAPAPVNAVELKPYKHQVGGHTPVYRFSRRAVCKQLNSKENKFYETVEQHHRELLGFMPRYIGVLNVTYRKDQKKRKQTVSEDAKPDEAVQSGKSPEEEAAKPAQPSEEPRMISHSMQMPSAVPQVIFENNRHLIPEHLFRVPPRSITPDIMRTRSSPPQRGTESDDETSNGGTRRPSLKPAQSWGFTSVNAQLRDHVLREVFTPPVIHRHDRRDRNQLARSLRRLPKQTQDVLYSQQRQNSIDVSSLQRLHSNASAASNPSRRSRLHQGYSDLGQGVGPDLEEVLRRNALSKSAETTEADLPLAVPSGRHHRRRHSGGGLRKVTDIEGNRGDLEFHEDDDDAYTADAEEDVFAMDDVKRRAQDDKNDSALMSNESSPQSAGSPEDQMMKRLGPAINFGSPEPRNPETSLVQHDERVERFLLLEDLTSGMQKPCVLDLKMGTRQYGIEANEKKQASQRMKCKMTTSRKLGVRVCGMQVYNVREQKYNFEDKYYGRDLKAGLEFEGALKRFFFDGIGHAQALKHIPSVLAKIDELDRIIRDLPGYRLYASSLLMIYDRGDADERGQVAETTDEYGRPAQYGDIKLKIVDFANCVTAEDMERVLRKPCPPQNPQSIDRGYVRGLRTLKAYFQKIYQELAAQRFVERGEGEGMALDHRGISGGTTHRGWTDSVIDDPGEVSV